MTRTRCAVLLLCSFFASPSAFPQQPSSSPQHPAPHFAPAPLGANYTPLAPPTPTRDPQAVATVAQAVAAAGGTQAFAAIQDYSATGQITYLWAGKEVTGSVTLRGRSPDQFRLDANLPDGTLSWLVSDGQGAIKQLDGKTEIIPFSNAVNLAFMNFPHAALARILNDATNSVTAAIGATGQQAISVHTQKIFNRKEDPHGELASWAKKDFVIDPSTLAVLETHDTVYSITDARQGYDHALIFSDFRPVNGVIVPFSITEKISGQQTWTVQLSSISFNTGLSSNDFHF